MELGEAFHSTSTLLLATALGFFAYLVLDRFVIQHGHDDEAHDGHAHTTRRGILGAGTLSGHSFIDGFAIGLAFQASPEVGAVVAAALIVAGQPHRCLSITDGRDPGGGGM